MAANCQQLICCGLICCMFYKNHRLPRLSNHNVKIWLNREVENDTQISYASKYDYIKILKVWIFSRWRTRSRQKKSVDRKATRKHVATKAARRGGPETQTKKPHRYRPETVALRDIRKFRESTELLIRKLPFQKIVGEMLLDHGNNNRVQPSAFLALQETAEAHLISVFEDKNRCSIRAKRVTVVPKDMHSARLIPDDRYWFL